MKGSHVQVAKIWALENFSLWQRLNSFAEWNKNDPNKNNESYKQTGSKQPEAYECYLL